MNLENKIEAQRKRMEQIERELAEDSRQLVSQPISAGHPFTVIIMA